ncbi:MAG: carboxymuconolactone decarboxylase family protein [Ferrovibrio sp.]
MYLKTIEENGAAGKVAEIYAAQKAQLGFVMSAAQCLTTREDLLPAYTDFVNTMRGGFTLSPRDWRIITLIAAREVRSTYCSMVYGKQLIADLGSKEMVLAVQRDFRTAGLSDRDVAMLVYAEKVARDATRVTQADIDALRAAGFTDANISDIALCAAFRCFIGRFFDAVGAGPEAAFIDDDPAWRDTLTVGRPAT